jgi:hypothetical protein
MDPANRRDLTKRRAEADSRGTFCRKGRGRKNFNEQSHYVYENEALYDKMTGEKQVLGVNIRTSWDYVTALCTEITLFAHYFELMCGHFAMTLTGPLPRGSGRPAPGNAGFACRPGSRAAQNSRPSGAADFLYNKFANEHGVPAGK